MSSEQCAAYDMSSLQSLIVCGAGEQLPRQWKLATIMTLGLHGLKVTGDYKRAEISWLGPQIFHPGTRLLSQVHAPKPAAKNNST